MIFLIISIICSVIVSVLLKLARRYKIGVVQAVTWNYLFAAGLAFFFFKPNCEDLHLKNVNGIVVLLGVLLPIVFWFLAVSVRNIGIVKTDISQRLSLFIPILAAYFLFGDTFSALKIAGFIVGFTAIIFTLAKQSSKQPLIENWLYPIVVFFGFGLIDVLFKQLSQIKYLPYTTSLIMVFVISFIVSLGGIAYLRFVKMEKIQLINFVCGCVLGFFNFFNILFYLKAHSAMADNPSTVFTAMNLGVIIAGTLVGILIFKEKLSRLNYVGLFLAGIAIVLITIAQVNAV
ncbi:MAG: EamA/RhaT family transporter [Pedobacter sp.]|nr:EamA/RhaT family transporter [Pedobacter sp.]